MDSKNGDTDTSSLDRQCAGIKWTGLLLNIDFSDIFVDIIEIGRDLYAYIFYQFTVEIKFHLVLLFSNNNNYMRVIFLLYATTYDIESKMATTLQLCVLHYVP